MKRYLILFFPLFILGCINNKGLERLQGVWLVDVHSTMIETSNLKYPILGWDDEDTPDNFSRIRYEIKNDQLNSYICYRCVQDRGVTNKISVYDEDINSVTILLHPKNNEYSSVHPSIKELIDRDPFSALNSIYGLKLFELTDANEAKLYNLAIDAKKNLIRKFSGIHLIRINGPLPERKPQIPKWINLENQNHALQLILSIPAINDEKTFYFLSIVQSSGIHGNASASWKVFPSRHKKGLKIFVKSKWKTGACETSFTIPYDEDAKGHKNGVTYQAIWIDSKKAEKMRKSEFSKGCI